MMKLETKASILAKAMRQIGAIIERRNTIPMLGCVRFDGRTISGTDLDIELSISVPATAAKGSICIDHRSLAALVRSIPGDDTIRIEAGREGATVSFSSGRYDLPSLPASDWPSLEAGDVKPAVLDPDQFRRAISFVSPFISTEETRYYLNGICLDGEVAVATDGHRLGCCPAGSDFSSFGRPIVPRKTVALFRSLPVPKSVSVGGNRILALHDGARLVSKLIDGAFPDWRRVVPEDADRASVLSVDPVSLAKVMARVTAIMGASRAYVTLAFGPAGLVVAGKRDDCTIREYVRSVGVTGEAVIGFQANYVRDLLEAFRGAETVDFTIVDPGSPVVAKAGSEGQFAVLMPTRVADESLARATLAEISAAPSIVGRAA